MISLRERMADVPQVGRVACIGVRPGRREPMQAVAEVEARTASGLAGDRYSGTGKRQVTLVQAEHLAVLASLLGGDAAAPAIDPARVRRNIVVRGINLLALRDAQLLTPGVIRVGDPVRRWSGSVQAGERREQ